MTSGLPYFAARSFRRVEKADGPAGSECNLLRVVINTLPSYDVKMFRHRVTSVSRRGAQ